jgi:hypothetical protein
MGLDTKAYWLTDRQSQCNFDFDFDFDFTREYNPCGGGVEYLHRDPASGRRRRKGKSQIWDSKVWPWVPRDSDPRKATWRGPSAYRKDRPVLSSERAPHKNKTVTVKRVINIWSWAPDGTRRQDSLIDWPSVAMWLWLWLWLTRETWDGSEKSRRLVWDGPRLGVSQLEKWVSCETVTDQ